MSMWSVVFLAILAAVTAEPLAVFPESANELLGSRIVSGWEAEEGQFPYQLSLRMVNPEGQVNACGGSIIHSEWGLTAAHCTATRVTMVIRAGAVSLTSPVYIFETTEYYNHPNYIDALQTVVQPDDIALLKFNRALTWSDRVKPIRIQASNDRNKDYSEVTMVASGWGRTWTSGTSPENLNWVYLRGVSNAECRSAYANSPIIVDTTICAAYYNVTSQSTCQGDSGGLLTVVDEDGEVTQVGVTSFVSGQGCHTVVPAGFIRPGHYHDWFEEVTGINFDWAPESEEESESSSEESSSEDSSSEEDSTEVETTAQPGVTTSPEPEPETTAQPEESTSSAPEPETTAQPVQPTSPAPESETTAQPAEPTTTVPEEGSTPAPEEEEESPEEEEDSSSEESEEEGSGTTAAPEEEETAATTAAPEEEEETSATTSAPEEEETAATTAAPEEEEETTEAPEDGEGSGEEDESSEEEGGEAANAFLRSYFGRFWN